VTDPGPRSGSGAPGAPTPRPPSSLGPPPTPGTLPGPPPGGAPTGPAAGADAAGVPPPPPGPGVRVPFGAPPGERDRRRLWIGLGVGGGLLGLCCVAGVLGTGAVLVQTGNDMRRQATLVVDRYLLDLRESDYSSAFGRYCSALRAQTSFAEFETAEERRTPVSSYTLGKPRPSGSAIWVRAEVVRKDGQRQTPDFKLVQEGETATSLKICQITQ
jgi:hypothetical protein